MDALVPFAVCDARLARELDAARLEKRSVCVRVDHLDLRELIPSDWHTLASALQPRALTKRV